MRSSLPDNFTGRWLTFAYASLRYNFVSREAVKPMATRIGGERERERERGGGGGFRLKPHIEVRFK